MVIQSKLLAVGIAALAIGVVGKVEAAGAPKGGANKSLTAKASSHTHAQLRPVIGVGPAFFWEDTDRRTENDQGGVFFNREEEEQLDSDGFVSLQAWGLFPMFFRGAYLGGGIGWYNKYAIKPADQDEDDEDSYEIGQMFSLAVQAEYLVPEVISKLNVMVGLRGGGLVAFPGGELLSELEGMDKSGYSVTPDLPRIGGFIAPHVGVSWPLSPKLRIRTDVGAQFSSLALWDGSAEAAGITSKRSSGLKTLRYIWTIGPELVL